jgi:hypothetical protein
MSLVAQIALCRCRYSASVPRRPPPVKRFEARVRVRVWRRHPLQTRPFRPFTYASIQLCRIAVRQTLHRTMFIEVIAILRVAAR